MKLNTLIINTYGGSLLLGAKMAGFKAPEEYRHGTDGVIIGSYEDSGFGSDIQEANFPGVPLIRTIDEWPKQNLKEVIVIAHPPCSAFSTMNSSPKAKASRGVDSGAFACTKKVVNYAASNNAAAICIESVCGALEGARTVHDELAAHHGYKLYRVLQNAITFGVPQWRNRFWCIFVRKDLDKGSFTFEHNPVFKSLRETLEGKDPGQPIEMLDRFWKEQVQYLTGTQRTIRTHTDNPNKITVPRRLHSIEVNRLMKGDLGFGPIPKVAVAHLSSTISPQKFDRNRGAFTGQWAHVWDPELYAGTVMGSSWWLCLGRVLGENDYKRIMGFPANYKFPDGTLRKNMRTYLSKGVVPQVAAWVLENVVRNLNETPSGNVKLCITIKPGAVADFRISKKDWRNVDYTPRSTPTTGDAAGE